MIAAQIIAKYGLANGIRLDTQPSTPAAYCSNFSGNTPVLYIVQSDQTQKGVYPAWLG